MRVLLVVSLLMLSAVAAQSGPRTAEVAAVPSDQIVNLVPLLGTAGRDVGDTCTAGVPGATSYFNTWVMWSGEAYGAVNDSVDVCECCSTTTHLPLRVCYFFAIYGDTTGNNIEYLAHAELWSTATSSACPDTPAVLICDGPQQRLSLPNPGAAFSFWSACLPLSNCTDLSCLPAENYISVVRFDSTDSDNDVYPVGDNTVTGTCWDWTDYPGNWVEFPSATVSLSIWADYECTGDLIPIELSSLSAVAAPGEVQVRWRTETESENLGFNVYRASDGERAKINEWLIPGAGTTLSPNDYQFVDREVTVGTRFQYWVSDVSFSGLETFHGPVVVVVPQESPAELGLTTEAAIGGVIFRMAIPAEGQAKLSVYDVAGHEVAVLVNQSLPAGRGQIEWDGTTPSGTAAPGAYIVRLIHDTGVVSAKAVLR
ncbi:hypothetical protein JXA88_15630 [Candidatus Fermentibacteria bacterium]|nr:hypothetical protein [Candidatus Fermentibacteria bacterium]